MSKKHLILIVDDDMSIGKMVTAMLTLEGFEAVHMPTPEEGISFATTKNPSLIILDYDLHASMDGFDMLVKLRTTEITKTIPILMLTGTANKMENIETAFHFGATAYLTKPVDLDRLYKKILSLLNLPSNP